MKRFPHWLLIGISIIIAVTGTASPIQAMSPVPVPQVPLLPPIPGSEAPQSMEALDEPGPSTLSLSGLKAVLVVGPIDGDYGEWTNSEKQNMDLAADELEANGVAVHRFYSPDNDWNQITAAAQDAQFFLYRGHGVYWPPPELPSPPVGGLALKNRIISSSEILNDLHLAPGAIVMLYACFSAGTSSADTSGIGSVEAQRRVAQYSDPFVDIGVAGYYANWFGSAFQMFVRYLFRGMTLGEAYEEYSDFDPDTVERFTHPNHPDEAMWLDKNYWSEMWKYSNAFVGQQNETLTSLFDPRAMVVTPAEMSYVAQRESPPKSFDLDVSCTTPETFEWTTTSPGNPSWLELQPSMSGMSGQNLDVILDPTGLGVGTYLATIQIVADDTTLQNGDQTVSVELHVIGEMNHKVFLPIVMR